MSENVYHECFSMMEKIRNTAYEAISDSFMDYEELKAFWTDAMTNAANIIQDRLNDCYEDGENNAAIFQKEFFSMVCEAHDEDMLSRFKRNFDEHGAELYSLFRSTLAMDTPAANLFRPYLNEVFYEMDELQDRAMEVAERYGDFRFLSNQEELGDRLYTSMWYVVSEDGNISIRDDNFIADMASLEPNLFQEVFKEFCDNEPDRVPLLMKAESMNSEKATALCKEVSKPHKQADRDDI